VSDEPEPGVVAVVPAHDEESRIADTVAALLSIPRVGAVIVVDDGSNDRTASVARRAGATVVGLSRNRGKAAALQRGLDETGGAGVVLFADADLGASAAALQAVLDPVLAGTADVAVAAPPRADGPSGFGAVEGLARWGIRRVTGVRLDRPLSGQRAARREVLAALDGFAPGFGIETSFTLDALRAGYRVVEVPCAISHARTGRDLAGFAHRARQGLDVARALAARARRRG